LGATNRLNGGNVTATQVTEGVKKVKGSGGGKVGERVAFSPAAAADIFILSSFFPLFALEKMLKRVPPLACVVFGSRNSFLSFLFALLGLLFHFCF